MTPNTLVFTLIFVTFAAVLAGLAWSFIRTRRKIDNRSDREGELARANFDKRH